MSKVIESIKNHIKELTLGLGNGDYAELMQELSEWCKEQQTIADYEVTADEFYPDDYDW